MTKTSTPTELTIEVGDVSYHHGVASARVRILGRGLSSEPLMQWSASGKGRTNVWADVDGKPYSVALTDEGLTVWAMTVPAPAAVTDRVTVAFAAAEAAFVSAVLRTPSVLEGARRDVEYTQQRLDEALAARRLALDVVARIEAAVAAPRS